MPLPNYRLGRRNRPIQRGAGTNSGSGSHRRDQSHSGDLNNILKSVLDRLNDLDQRFNDLTKKTTTNTKIITPLINLETRPPPPRSSSEGPLDKSDNPDFALLWRGLFKGAQLTHHRKNWENTPRSIHKRLMDIGEFITPPIPNPDTIGQIKNIMSNTANNIRDCVIKHIDHCITENRKKLGALNPTDKNKAFDIAHRHLKIRLGNKTQEDFLNKCLSDEMKFLAKPESRDNHIMTKPSVPPEQEDHNSDMEWTTVGPKNKNKKRPPPSNHSPSPRTSRNVSILHQLDHTVEPSDTEPEERTSANRPHPSKRPRANTSSSTNHTNTYSLKNPPPSCHTIVVTDSNMSKLTEAHIPSDWYLSNNRGVNISQTIDLINNMTITPELKYIVLAVGINDRENGRTISAKFLRELGKAISVKAQDGITVIFSATAYGPKLPKNEAETIDYFNSSVQETYPLNYIPTLSPTEITSSSDHIHHTVDSTLKIWHKIIEETVKIQNTATETKN